MKFDLSNTRIFIRPGITDLRISTDEILHLIKKIMNQDLLSGAVFLFCNKRKNILKAIWWDKTGITLEEALKMLEAANSIIQRQQKEITDQQIKKDAQKVLIQKKEEELSKTQTEINQINRVIDKKNKEINKKNLEIEQKRIEIIQLQEKLATQLRYRFCAHSEKMDNQPSLENGKTIEIHLDFMQGSNKDFTMTSTLLKEAGVSFTKNDSETLLSDELTEKLVKRFAVVHTACAYPHDSFSYNPD